MLNETSRATKLILLLQLLIVVLQTDSAEFGLTIAAIPVVLFLLIGAGIAVQREIKWYATRPSPHDIRVGSPFECFKAHVHLARADACC